MRLAMVVAALVLAGASSIAMSGTYLNDEFGFSAEVAAGTSTCRAEAPEHDHGINIFLDSGGSGCDGLEARPYLGVGASYNAAEYSSAEEALGDICHSRGATRVSAPPHLEIAGLRSASCRANSADKAWIDLYVRTQSGEAGEIADANYDANLHTTPQRFEADLARFRGFLERVKIWGLHGPKPGP